MQSVQVLCTDFGNFPVPADMAQLRIRWRKRGGWPDMRTNSGREWVKMFRAFTATKAAEYMARA